MVHKVRIATATKAEIRGDVDETNHSECRVCGARIENKRQGQERKTCSDKCRQQAYRSRKDATTD